MNKKRITETYDQYLKEEEVTARALVLDGRHGAFLSPIDGLGNIDDVSVAEALGAGGPGSRGGLGPEAQILALELLVAHVGELVEAEPVFGDLLVPLVDVLQVVLEDLEPLDLLLDAAVHLAVLREPVVEELDELVDAGQVLRGVAEDRELVDGERRAGKDGEAQKCQEGSFW